MGAAPAANSAAVALMSTPANHGRVKYRRGACTFSGGRLRVRGTRVVLRSGLRQSGWLGITA
eukprot:10116485-Lingulodinium_polyedra.AAC.1